MHESRQELRPLRTAFAAPLLTLWVAGGHASAQAPGADPATRAIATADAGFSRVAGEWVPQAGGTLSFRISPFLEVGGGARIDLSHPTFTSQGSTSRLRFGYGGLQVALRPAPQGWPDLRLGALIGAGNLDVQDPAVGTVLDSDNGAVLEPYASWSLPLTSKVAGGASFSWRFAYGFTARGGIASGDLSGPALLLRLVLGPF